jgi:transposase-like protein
VKIWFCSIFFIFFGGGIIFFNAILLICDSLRIFAAKLEQTMNCPKCRNNSHVKDGTVRGKQRYRCKECQYRYTVERKSDVKTLNIRKVALELYLEGFGFRHIGRILRISYGTVYSWIKLWSASVCFPRNGTENLCKTVELDELLAYAASKKAAGQHGLLLIDLEKEISLLSTHSALGEPD